jgi:hypothetical protein
MTKQFSNKDEIDYSDLLFRNKLLYDFSYASTKKKCYNHVLTTIDNIEKIDIMVDCYDISPFLANKQKLTEKNVLQKIMLKDASFVLAKYGNYFSENDEINHKTDVYRDVKIAFILFNSLVNNPHKMILTPLVYTNLNSSQIKKLTGKPCETKNNYLKVFENYHNNKLLKDCIDFLNENTYTTIIFQVLYILSQITTQYNDFRHNKLDFDAIVICEKKTPTKFETYIVGDTEFEVPSHNMFLKLTNFDHVSIKEHKILSSEKEKNSDNLFYDIHYFLNYFCLYVTQKLKGTLPDNVHQMIHSLIPDEIYSTDINKFSGLDEIKFNELNLPMKTASQILEKNILFRGFIKPQMTKEISLSRSASNSPSMHNNISSITQYSDEPLMLAKKINIDNKYIDPKYSEMSSTKNYSSYRESNDLYEEYGLSENEL